MNLFGHFVCNVSYQIFCICANVCDYAYSVINMVGTNERIRWRRKGFCGVVAVVADFTGEKRLGGKF